MKPKRYYAVGLIEAKRECVINNVPSILPASVDLSLAWAPGQVGVMAVFTNKKTALAYANKKADVFKYEPKEEKCP